MKIYDMIVWAMFGVSSAISVLTTLVIFGMIDYSGPVKLFGNFMPLEISLAITLFLWGIRSLYRNSNHKSKNKKTFFCYLLMSVLTLFFVFQHVY